MCALLTHIGFDIYQYNNNVVQRYMSGRYMIAILRPLGSQLSQKRQTNKYFKKKERIPSIFKNKTSIEFVLPACLP